MPEPIQIYPQQLFTVTVDTKISHDYTFPASTNSEARNYVMEMLRDPSQTHYLDELCTAQAVVNTHIVAIQRMDDHEI